jgi:hypothetical protein
MASCHPEQRTVLARRLWDGFWWSPCADDVVSSPCSGAPTSSGNAAQQPEQSGPFASSRLPFSAAAGAMDAIDSGAASGRFASGELMSMPASMMMEAPERASTMALPLHSTQVRCTVAGIVVPSCPLCRESMNAASTLNGLPPRNPCCTAAHMSRICADRAGAAGSKRARGADAAGAPVRRPATIDAPHSRPQGPRPQHRRPQWSGGEHTHVLTESGRECA